MKPDLRHAGRRYKILPNRYFYRYQPHTPAKAGAYYRAVTENKTHNFVLALPEHLSNPPPKSALLEVYSTG
jgi:hypothetical protein